MIGKLKGVVDSYGEDFVILDVQGVGYVVQCSGRTLQALPRPGEAAVLSIETQVREDAIRLFGFREPGEQEWFKLLQTVQGVGAKLALAILSAFDAEELTGAIASRDKAKLQRAQGVGARLAERLVSELKDKISGFIGADPLVAKLSGAVETRSGLPQPVADAISALVNLGYGQPQASAAIAAALKSAGDSAAASQLVRLGLRELAR